MNSYIHMENDYPNHTTTQLLIQHISEAVAKSFSTPNQYGDAILLFNTDLLCIEANIPACQSTGYSKNELLTLHLADLLHIDELQQPIADINTLKANGTL